MYIANESSESVTVMVKSLDLFTPRFMALNLELLSVLL